MLLEPFQAIYDDVPTFVYRFSFRDISEAVPINLIAKTWALEVVFHENTSQKILFPSLILNSLEAGAVLNSVADLNAWCQCLLFSARTPHGAEHIRALSYKLIKPRDFWQRVITLLLEFTFSSNLWLVEYMIEAEWGTNKDDHVCTVEKVPIHWMHFLVHDGKIRYRYANKYEAECDKCLEVLMVGIRNRMVQVLVTNDNSLNDAYRTAADVNDTCEPNHAREEMSSRLVQKSLPWLLNFLGSYNHRFFFILFSVI